MSEAGKERQMIEAMESSRVDVEGGAFTATPTQINEQLAQTVKVLTEHANRLVEEKRKLEAQLKGARHANPWMDRAEQAEALLAIHDDHTDALVEDKRKLENALLKAEAFIEKAAVGKRPDGTYNYSREALEQQAKNLLNLWQKDNDEDL